MFLQKNTDVHDGLKCLYTNADSLQNKLPELELYVESENVDIVAITESLCKNPSEFYDPIFMLKGFACVSNNAGRGTLLFIRNNLEYVRLSQYEEMFSPCTVCKINLDKNNVFVFGVIYRSPNCTEELSLKINDMITHIADKYRRQQVVLVGDLNYRDIDWEKDVCDKNDGHISSQFLECVHSNCLYQLVDQPTHHRGDQTPTLIDLVISNQNDLVHDIKYNAPLGKSHHSMISFQLDVIVDKDDVVNVEKYIFDKGDYDGMRKFISDKDWKLILNENRSLNDWNDELVCNIEDAKTRFIPKKRFNSNKTKRKFAAPNSLHQAFHFKRKAFKRKKKFASKENNDEYVYYRNLVNKEVKLARRDKEKKVAREAKNNPKVIYQYFASMCKQKEAIPHLKKPNDSMTKSDFEKAQVLSDFFKSVYTEEGTGPLPDVNIENVLSMPRVNITQDGVKKALENLNGNKSQGPDGMHPRILKELAEELSYPLYKIFKRSISEGKIPDKWREAEVRAIFKKGKKTEPGNYRPVSLTSIICKVLEGFLRNS